MNLYRGSSAAGSRLLAAPPTERPPLELIQRLHTEYALRDELSPAWAARPLELTIHLSRPVLLLEDPGGEPLERLLLQALDISTFLRIAIPLVTALRHVHLRGLVHKDLKPSHILVGVERDSVHLTGFGVASRLPRERQAPDPPAAIAGSLAYMAPEQTGRMNRSIDSRTDLYSLGVTFYRMLTGELPFAATDPMEWVHCHIARRPIPLSERLPTISEPISSLVMKLLSKTPEDRYQTAEGVEVDLHRCLTEWQLTVALLRFRSAHETDPSTCSSPRSCTAANEPSRRYALRSSGLRGRGGQSSCCCRATRASANRRSSTNCRRWFRCAAYSPQVSSTSINVTFPTATLAQAFRGTDSDAAGSIGARTRALS